MGRFSLLFMLTWDGCNKHQEQGQRENHVACSHFSLNRITISSKCPLLVLLQARLRPQVAVVKSDDATDDEVHKDMLEILESGHRGLGGHVTFQQVSCYVWKLLDENMKGGYGSLKICLWSTTIRQKKKKKRRNKKKDLKETFIALYDLLFLSIYLFCCRGTGKSSNNQHTKSGLFGHKTFCMCWSKIISFTLWGCCGCIFTHFLSPKLTRANKKPENQ